MKFIFEEKKKGGDVTITQSGNDSTLVVNTGTQTFNISNSILQIANGSLTHYEHLATSLSEHKVHAISLGKANLPEIKLTKSDSDLFVLPSKISLEPISIDCEIYEFDKYSNKGRLKVFDRAAIPRDEYKFVVVGNQNNLDYIEAMLEKRVNVTCLEEVVDHPLRGSVVAALQVMTVSALP